MSRTKVGLADVEGRERISANDPLEDVKQGSVVNVKSRTKRGGGREAPREKGGASGKASSKEKVSDLTLTEMGNEVSVKTEGSEGRCDVLHHKLGGSDRNSKGNKPIRRRAYALREWN